MTQVQSPVVLLADDDATIRFVVAKALTNYGYTVRSTDNPHTLMKWTEQGEGDVVLSDVHMGPDDVFDYIPKMKSLRPNLPIIIISANTGVMTALKSRKAQVFDYIPKPFDLDALSDVVKRATYKPSESVRGKALARGPMIGKSQVMQPVFRDMAILSGSDVSVLIHGDAGTGKTLCAEVLHEFSGAKGRVLIRYSPETDFGTFSKSSNGVTLLVERIDELNEYNQLRLLRLLEGGAQEFKVKPRLVATSSLSPGQLIENKKVRNDLAVHFVAGQIALPTLAQRTEDIAPLAEHFLSTGLSRGGRQTLSPNALLALGRHAWPGNVRELELTLQKLAMTYPDAVLSRAMIESVLLGNGAQEQALKMDLQSMADIRERCRALLLDDISQDQPSHHAVALAWVEKPLIEEALKLCNGNFSKTAILLGVHRNTLRTKIKALGISMS